MHVGNPNDKNLQMEVDYGRVRIANELIDEEKTYGKGGR